MGYKCTPQLKGLVRGEPKPGKKFRANGRAIAEEAGNERYSKSETLDRSRSTQNVYDGYKSGGACWEAMCEDAGAYRITGKTKNGKPFERSLREDAVIGFALIFNPPDEMTIGWTDADYDKFYADSFDAMHEIEPRLFRKDNIRMTADHHDEGNKRDDGTYGLHKHVLGDCLDEDGHYCGNLIDVKLMNDINAKYPTFMRQRGWDLEDLDITDRSRMGKNPDGTYKDPEYREQRLNRRKSGRSVNEYLADIAADKKAELDAYDLASYQELDEELKKYRAELSDKLTAEFEAQCYEADAEFAERKAAQEQELSAEREAFEEECAEREAALDERKAALDAKEKDLSRKQWDIDKSLTASDRREQSTKSNNAKSSELLKTAERYTADAQNLFNKAMNTLNSIENMAKELSDEKRLRDIEAAKERVQTQQREAVAQSWKQTDFKKKIGSETAKALASANSMLGNSASDDYQIGS